MKAIIQKVANAKVTINSSSKSIEKGLLIYLAISKSDTKEKVKDFVLKILKLKIFEEDKNFQLPITKTNYQIMIISQFTLYATYNSNKPNFSNSMNFNDAKILYDLFLTELKSNFDNVQAGEFGEYMEIEATNLGPINLIIEN